MLACWSFGLIGLSQFLQRSVSFFCPNPFLRSLPCSFSPFRYAALRSITPQNILYPKQECRHSFRKLHSINSIPFAHSVATLAQPAKKTTLHSKNSASPAVNGSRPQPSFRYRYIPGYLLPPPSLHSQRLAPLPTASKKITPLRSANFLLASGRLKAALPALFSLRALPPHSA